MLSLKSATDWGSVGRACRIRGGGRGRALCSPAGRPSSPFKKSSCTTLTDKMRSGSFAQPVLVCLLHASKWLQSWASMSMQPGRLVNLEVACCFNEL